MGWLDQTSGHADDLRRARDLQRGGRSAESARLLETVAATASLPPARADALVQRLGALINLGRAAEYRAAADAAWTAVQDLPDPYLRGHLHAYAAVAAHLQGTPDRGAAHLVGAERALGGVADPGEETAWAWHDLAVAASYLGFTGYALTALDRARQIGAGAGVPAEALAAPGIRLRSAVSLDHLGDTDGCLRALRDLAAEPARFAAAGTAGRVRPGSRAAYRYAAARRAALGDGPAPAAGDPGDTGDSVRVRDLRQLADVCADVAAGDPAAALARLDALAVSPETLGPAEPARLRGLAHAAAGDHAAAHAADRLCVRLATAGVDRLREGYLEGVAARLDLDGARGGGRGAEALTDPLTGLPNRRFLERYVSTMLARGERAAIGVCDITGFAALAAAHGGHVGDLVLQRFAAVLNRVMRSGDVVVRYGGDEFVVVLPGAGAGQAADVSRRITDAVAAQDWAVLAPGTPIGVTVGWADGTATGRGLTDALAAASARRPAA